MVKIQTGIYKPYITRQRDDDKEEKLDESKDEEAAGISADNIIRYRSYFPVKLWPN